MGDDRAAVSGFVLASLITVDNVHDTRAAGLLFDRAARNGGAARRLKIDGLSVGPRSAQAAKPNGPDVRITTRVRDANDFKPPPLR